MFNLMLNLIDLYWNTYTALVLYLYCTRTLSDCRHGFNKQTPRFFLLDQIKHLLLSLALSLPIGAAIIWIVKAGGPLFYFYLWAFLFAVQVDN